MTGITKWNDIGDDMFCKSQLITCNRVKECNGVCPFEDALKHADKTQTMNDQHTVDHDRDWIIGCIEHDGFIHTHRFDKANQIIHNALSADAGWIPVEEQPPVFPCLVCDANGNQPSVPLGIVTITDEEHGEWHIDGRLWDTKIFFKGEWCSQTGYGNRIIAWMPLPTPYKGGDTK